MTRWQKGLWLLLSVVMLLPLPEKGGAQGLYVYPARGQSPQQEESDKGQCYGWAVQQTGFQQNALAQGRSNYDRAFSACMTARGYTVN